MSRQVPARSHVHLAEPIPLYEGKSRRREFVERLIALIAYTFTIAMVAAAIWLASQPRPTP